MSDTERYEILRNMSDFKKENVHQEQSNEKIEADFYQAIMNGQHVILAGPPGTGKTRMVHRLKTKLESQNLLGCFNFTQFHPEYSYQDFIEGFKPKKDGQGFEPKEGAFRNYVSLVNLRKEHDNVVDLFIIDEINRGNVASIFGELLSLMDNTDLKSVKTAQSNTELVLPRSISIIGTMNTADKNIMLMDFAFRRRFSFIFVPPDYDGLKSWLTQYGFDFDSFSMDDYVNALKALNSRISGHPLLGKRMTLGQSMFVPKMREIRKINITDLTKLFNQVIIPQLETYMGVGSISEIDGLLGEGIRNKIKSGNEIDNIDLCALILSLNNDMSSK